MPFRTSIPLFVLVALVFATRCEAADSVIVIGDDPGVWPAILQPFAIPVKEAIDLPPSALLRHLDAGSVVVLVGASEHAEALGIKTGSSRVTVRSLIDNRNPKLSIVWKKQLELPVAAVPEDAEIFARERWTNAPLLVGIRRGAGAALWLAAPPGDKGYERFPYLAQALVDLGVAPPFRSNRLWAFFDGAYRSRVDLDYFAERWRRAGISALHVAAWHYMEPDKERDEWVRRLVKACHRRAIHVYAWLELPHVSEDFWRLNPDCREKTALLQDAHLDWRKLVNLTNSACAEKVSTQVDNLLTRFDWDGVNLAELYFESLEGVSNPARFTPMNDDVRREYRERQGLDPISLFKPDASKEQITAFLTYRADLARRMQEHWIGEINRVRLVKPHLDLVLTHVDDRFDTSMRDLIGADAARVLPMLAKSDFTFLIEDPATVWHLGPDRYAQIAKSYAPLTPRQDKLAIDINIVERYQDVYPTKQQTGTELFQLLHVASAAFPRVAVYFENSILKADWNLLPAATAVVSRHERIGPKLVVESPRGVGVMWEGPAFVNGRPWPLSDGKMMWLPPGAHVIEASSDAPSLRVIDFNGEVTSARAEANAIEFAYRSDARAMAVLNEMPGAVEVDGELVNPSMLDGNVLVLPRGQHVVTLR